MRIYSVHDVAQSGKKPVQELTEKLVLRYEERRLGIQRYYTAKQNQVKIDRVIRCPRTPVTSQDIAITEDGERYRVDLVQIAPDANPPAIDLTLVKFDQR